MACLWWLKWQGQNIRLGLTWRLPYTPRGLDTAGRYLGYMQLGYYKGFLACSYRVLELLGPGEGRATGTCESTLPNSYKHGLQEGLHAV